ncbi:MAG: Rieske (2Fe-2S) protein [Chloroflexi bacterium]|nr:Rieske (2Fe-2S) protein [Chloroflexota bacterium]
MYDRAELRATSAAPADDLAYLPVAKTRDVKPGQLKGVRARGGYEFVIANVDERYYAFDAYCPHNNWPLKWGAIDRGTLVCGLHLWRFDLETGRVLDPPMADCLGAYPVKIENDTILVGVRPK